MKGLLCTNSYGKGAAGFWFMKLMVMYKEETSLAIIQSK
jgi:hypothetical protein